MTMPAVEFPIRPLRIKNSGTLTSAPQPRQRSCLFVRFRKTFSLTFDRSFGTFTYAIVITSNQ